MDAKEIMDYVANNLFSIAVAGYLLVYYIPKSNEAHKEEVSSLTKAIENNTNVMTRLVDKLEER